MDIDIGMDIGLIKLYVLVRNRYELVSFSVGYHINNQNQLNQYKMYNRYQLDHRNWQLVYDN